MFQEQIIWIQLQPPNNLAQEQKKHSDLPHTFVHFPEKKVKVS